MKRWSLLLDVTSTLIVSGIEEISSDLYDISVDSEDHAYGWRRPHFAQLRSLPERNEHHGESDVAGSCATIYGDGTQVRCFSYISDSLACLVKMADDDAPLGEVINIGPDEGEITINELYQKLANITGFNQPPIYMPGRPQEVHHAVCSSDKARRLLGYETKVMPDEGMKYLVEWIEKRGTRPFEYHFDLEFTTAKTPKTWTDRLF